MKLSQAIDSFLETKKGVWNTFRLYRGDLREFLAHMGDIEVENVGLSQILEWKEAGGYSISAWRRKSRAVKSMFWYLVERGILAENPLSGYNIPKLRVVQPLGKVDVKALLRFRPKTVDERRALVVALLALDGLYPKEMLSLTVDDVNLELDVVAIEFGLFPLSPETVEAIRAWLVVRPQQGKQAALLTNQCGGRLGTSQEAKLGLLGIEGLNLQRLYATYMKRLQEKYHTTDLQTLQAITGRPEMTAVEWAGDAADLSG